MQDFFNAERRFIFGVKSELEGQKWINEINRAVIAYREPESLSRRRQKNALQISTEVIEESILDQ